jgi:hypothetical protein
MPWFWRKHPTARQPAIAGDLAEQAREVQEGAFDPLALKPEAHPRVKAASFTFDEIRLIRAMAIAVQNPDDPATIKRAALALKPEGEPPAVTKEEAVFYTEARIKYKSVPAERVIDMKNTAFIKARHNLHVEVSKDRKAYKDSPTDEGRTMEERYFGRGDMTTAMNTLVEDRAREAMKRALNS